MHLGIKKKKFSFVLLSVFIIFAAGRGQTIVTTLNKHIFLTPNK